MILGLHHAQFTIPPEGEAEARTYYLELLGLKEIPKPDNLRRGGFWMLVGAREVHVGTQEGGNRFQLRSHFAYEVDDLANWRRKIAGAGFGIEEPPPFDGHIRFHTRDPFGNLVEFIQRVGSNATSASGIEWDMRE
ncbi:MAG TPA: VOC family protein [Tepidisphaeraceae bacterium]|jgi:catechol 2,3-dioxygenase-like lactoylglutathione lyase family enzyme|nr:VOC family protein [Tepidisphaeraceae bacterium]